MPTFRGSCLCGEIAFDVEGPFDLFLNCHCSRCRKASGTAHSCEVIVKARALRWLPEIFRPFFIFQPLLTAPWT
jgi:hypothetical protein